MVLKIFVCCDLYLLDRGCPLEKRPNDITEDVDRKKKRLAKMLKWML